MAESRVESNDASTRNERRVESNDASTTNERRVVQSQEKCSIKIKRARINNKNCIVCKKSSNKLHVISKSARIDAFIETSILIDPKSRSCSSHFEGFHKESRLTDESLQKIEVFDDISNLTTEELLEIVEALRYIAKHNTFAYRFSDYSRIDPQECQDFLGTNILNIII